MAILTYFDASGDDTHPAMAVGGLLARPEQWQAFDTAWRSVLNDEGVPELHMKHFAHSLGPFKAWKGDETRRARFLERLTGVMNTNVLKNTGVSLFTDHWNDFDKMYMLREAFGGPYAFTAFFAMNAVRVWRDRNHPGEPISYVFETGDKDQSWIVRALQMLRLEGEFNVSFQPKHWQDESGHTHYHYPFQACDFVAYECGKASRTILEQDAKLGRMVDEIKPRRSLMGFAPKQRDLTWRFIDAGLLREFCQGLRVKPRLRRIHL